MECRFFLHPLIIQETVRVSYGVEMFVQGTASHEKAREASDVTPAIAFLTLIRRQFLDCLIAIDNAYTKV